MKKLMLVLLLLANNIRLLAQNQMVNYEYWFDDNFNSRVSANISPSQILNLNSQINASTLVPGVHLFSFRSKDQNNRYSNIESYFFFKRGIESASGNINMMAYEYWFDNNFSSRVSVNISPAQVLNLNSQINASTLVPGVHLLSFRAKDQNNRYSHVESYFFFKRTPELFNGNNQILAYEYWFDNATENKVLVEGQFTSNFSFSTPIFAKNLVHGVHLLNIRFRQQNQLWSSINSHLFYKNEITLTGPIGIHKYRYWLANFPESVTTVNLPDTSIQYLLIRDLDLKSYSKGNYTVNFQFQDIMGKWSVIYSQNITKNPYPLAIFDFTKNENQDSTLLSFNNKSIDADNFSWKFGDGDSSNVQHALHYYNVPGLYTIRLIAKDITSGLTNVKDSIILIKGRTYSEINTQSCGAFTSPSGKFLWHSSGVFKDTLINHWGYDSVITFNLTVFPVINPAVPIASDVSRCGPGVVNLTASGCSSGILKWYNQPSGGQILGTGPNFTTQSLTQSTTFYVSCIQNACESTRKAVLAQLQINLTHLLGALLPGVYKVSNNIESRALIGNPTIYQAGQSILLQPGFHVPKGTVFKASIAICN